MFYSFWKNKLETEPRPSRTVGCCNGGSAPPILSLRTRVSFSPFLPRAMAWGEPSSDPRHPRRKKTSAERRQQRLRASARVSSALLRAFSALQHRGCQHTNLGAALAHALAGDQPQRSDDVSDTYGAHNKDKTDKGEFVNEHLDTILPGAKDDPPAQQANQQGLDSGLPHNLGDLLNQARAGTANDIAHRLYHHLCGRHRRGCSLGGRK